MVGADPLRRLPRVLPAPVRAASCAERRDFQPPRHAHRGARAGRAEGDRRRPRLLLRDLPRERVRRSSASTSSSCRTTTRARCAARSARCTSSSTPGPGEADPRRARARSTTWRSTCGATRPPTAQYEAFELSDENARQIFVPVGFAHGFCVTSERRTSPTRCRATTTGRPSAGSRWTTRRSGFRGRRDEPLVSDRDRSNPTAGRDRARAALVARPRRDRAPRLGGASTEATSRRVLARSTRTSSGAPRSGPGGAEGQRLSRP